MRNFAMLRYVPSPPQLITAATMALALGAVGVLLPGQSTSDLGTALFITSVANLALGFYVFLVHGGVFVTPTGLYFFSAALLVGGAGLYGSLQSETALFASAAILVGNLLVLVVRFRRAANWARPAPIFIEPIEIQAGFRVWVWTAGVGLLVVGVVFQNAGSTLGPLSAAVAFSGVALLMLGLATASAHRNARYLVLEVVGAGLGFLVYYRLFFGGFGRLVMVALILCAALAINLIQPRSWHKPGLVVALIPALLVAGIIETTRGQQEENLGRFSVSADEILLEGAGLASAIGPLRTMVEVIDADDGGLAVLERRYGMTFIESLTAPIPRAIWPQKPVGLGFAYSLALTPELAVFGHSLAALAYGEWYVNFGWLGFLVVPPFVAYGLGLLDRWQLRTLTGGIRSRSGFIGVLMLLLLVSGIPDYVWVGTFTFAARSGVRVLVILPLYLFFRRVERNSQPIRAARPSFEEPSPTAG